MKENITVLKGYNENPIERVTIEDTSFIFKTNLQGDPRRDERYGSRECKANVIVSEDFAVELENLGCKVRHTNPDEDNNVTNFVAVKVNFNSRRAPKIFLVSGDNEPRPIDEELINQIDDLADRHAIANIKLVANTYLAEGREFKTLYIDTMYIEQSLDDDPFYSQYHGRGATEVPFA